MIFLYCLPFHWSLTWTLLFPFLIYSLTFICCYFFPNFLRLKLRSLICDLLFSKHRCFSDNHDNHFPVSPALVASHTFWFAVFPLSYDSSIFLVSVLLLPWSVGDWESRSWISQCALPSFLLATVAEETIPDGLLFSQHSDYSTSFWLSCCYCSLFFSEGGRLLISSFFEIFCL